MPLDTDNLIITNSLLKSFRSCPRKALYKYIELVTPRQKYSQPLERGSWFHELLEARYKGEDVKAVHTALCEKYHDLTDEEKDTLGDLPREMPRLYNSYNWYYRGDKSWEVHEVEMKVEAELPNGLQYQGKIDMLIEDEYGLWAVDHKTHKRLPSLDYRYRDTQSVLYIWALRECGIPVKGFIWNYVVPTAPEPLRIKVRGGLYARQPITDYPTALKGLKAEGLENEPEYAEILKQLKTIRYEYGATQNSPVFRRDVLEKHDDMIARTLAEATYTADRFVEYAWENKDAVERLNDRSCDWCEYKYLCIAELVGVNSDNVRRQMYKKANPLAYYEEKDRK
ncbi:DNA helicase [Mycobacterium phage Muddy]|uniref:Helicase n=2 Tax=Mycobacterium phage Muddy TaxID=1340829 RepID=S5Z5W7_9CAUD|nr:DNA helicase [Mycobacterium phage Muddy]WEV84087.1 DNA helicase [Mycobacterium phage Muddy]